MINRKQSDLKRSLSRPALTIISINIEGISSDKEDILAELCKTHSCNVICLQKTYRDKDMKTPRINGIKLVALPPHRKYCSAIFVKPYTLVKSIEITEINNVEVLTVEDRVTNTLNEVGEYYKNNSLRPNPTKTEICALHLKNREAKRKLLIQWNGIELKNNQNPKYLGVTLDRSLTHTFKEHCEKTKLIVNTRNGLLRKLV